MPKFNGFRGGDVEKEMMFVNCSKHKLELKNPFPPEKIFTNHGKLNQIISYLMYYY